MRIIKNKILEIMQRNSEIFLTIINLPSVYKLKDKKYILLIILLTLASYTVISGIALNIANPFLLFTIISLTLINLIYIIFNLIIRIYNIFYRVLKYFLVNKEIERKIVIGYYIFNIISIILTSIILIKIQNNLIIYEQITSIIFWLFVLSCIIAVLYINHISNEEIIIKEININSLPLLILINLILMLILTLASLNILLSNKSYYQIHLYMMDPSSLENSKDESVNIIKQDNTSEQITLSEQANKNAANQSNGNIQSGDKNIVVQTNKQQFNYKDPNININDNPFENRGRSLIHKSSIDSIRSNKTINQEDINKISNFKDPFGWIDKNIFRKIKADPIFTNKTISPAIKNINMEENNIPEISSHTAEIKELTEKKYNLRNLLNSCLIKKEKYIFEQPISTFRIRNENISELDEHDILKKIYNNQKYVYQNYYPDIDDTNFDNLMKDFCLSINYNRYTVRQILENQIKEIDNLIIMKNDSLCQVLGVQTGYAPLNSYTYPKGFSPNLRDVKFYAYIKDILECEESEFVKKKIVEATISQDKKAFDKFNKKN